jgi:hypothetical protein
MSGIACGFSERRFEGLFLVLTQVSPDTFLPDHFKIMIVLILSFNYASREDHF